MAPCATFEITYRDPMGGETTTRVDATSSAYALQIFLRSCGSRPMSVLSVTEVIPAAVRSNWLIVRVIGDRS